MLIRKKQDIKSSEITPRDIYLSRRQLIACAMVGALTGSLYSKANSWDGVTSYNAPKWLKSKVYKAKIQPNNIGEATPYKYASQYNNFYEFGTDKDDPYKNAQKFVTDPWSVKVYGAVNKPKTFALEDLLKPHLLEERVYRLRCVEAWSMVIPWIGFSLAKLIKQVEPKSNAKYLAFKTLYDPEQMPDQGKFFKAIDYPYIEGLRMDEAMNPLTILAVGMYGDTMPPQNGAPMRLVVPWKYGFKSIKSIVSIEFTEKQPKTTWENSAPREYGFYANVNPEVDHPRWSQATERRLPSPLFSFNKVKTKLFNGYAEQVEHLYKGMDLRKNF